MKRNLITILALIIALSSCNDDALFEKEMYKNVVALISSDYYNTFEEVVTLSPTGRGGDRIYCSLHGRYACSEKEYGHRAGRRPDFIRVLQPFPL